MALNTYWSNDSKGRKAEEYLHNKNACDVNCWMVLVREAQLRKIEDSRILFERALSQFPQCYRFLKLYIEKETKDGSVECLDELFKRFLPILLNVELYSTYLNFVKNVKNECENFPEIMLEAYEFAIDNIGCDFHSTPIWLEYIQFFKNSEAVGTYAESKKITKIRKLYYKVLSLPLSGIDQFWKDYTAFEQGLNKTSADKIAVDRAKEYNITKKIAKDVENMLKGIIRPCVPVPPEYSSSENLQLDLWNKYIEWEKSNPLGIEDSFLLAKRVVYSYEQYLQNYSFHAFIWLEVTQYLEVFHRKLLSEGDKQRAHDLATICRAFYKRGIDGPMRTNTTFHLCFADFEESFNNIKIANEVYVKLLHLPDVDRSLIYCHYLKFAYRTSGIEEARRVFHLARNDSSIDYNIYVCAAFNEFYQNKDYLASIKIFESGVRRFPNSDKLIFLYLQHIRRIPDLSLVRSSYERLIKLFETDSAPHILNHFHRFEAEYGNLSSYHQLEDRIIKKYARKNQSLKLIHQRYDRDYFQHFKISKCEASCCLTNSQSIKKPTASNIISFNPDLTQMRPFKPIGNIPLNIELPSLVPGGVFIPPPKICEIISLLPHSSFYYGPFIDVEFVLDALRLFGTDHSNIYDGSGPSKYLSEMNNNGTQPKERTFNDKKNILYDLYGYRQTKHT